MLPAALPEAMLWLSWQAATLVMRPDWEQEHGRGAGRAA